MDFPVGKLIQIYEFYLLQIRSQGICDGLRCLLLAVVWQKWVELVIFAVKIENAPIMIYAETDRLLLRAWKREDLPLFIAMNKDERVMKYFPAPLTDVETEAFFNRIQDEFERKGWGLYAVELKKSGKFIGYVGLHEIGFEAHFTPGVEIGWRLAADYHNLGYATEAAERVMSIADSLGITQVYSFTAEINKPSERVMQKIGMEKIGEFDHPKLSADSPLCRHVLYCK